LVDGAFMMNPILITAFDRHAAATFDKQSYLDDLVGKLGRWDFDMERGVLSFGGQKHQWKVQLLGTQSDQSGTWLWAWGNEASEIPKDLLAAANSLRNLGADKGISELCTAKLPTDKRDGHFWAILATGLCKANAYYRAPYEGGAVFLLIKDTTYQRQIVDPLCRLLSVFPQAISTFEISNHKHALAGHAEYQGLSVQPQGDVVLIADSHGKRLLAKFDDHNRLVELSGTLKATSQSKDTTSARQAEQSTDPITYGDRGQIAVPLSRKVGRYLKLWLHHCRMNIVAGIVITAILAVVVGLVTWVFTSLGTAAIVGVIVSALYLIYGFHPQDLETDARYLRRTGWVTIWLTTMNSRESLKEYLESARQGFRLDVGFGPIDFDAVTFGMIGQHLDEDIRRCLRGSANSAELSNAIVNASQRQYRSFIVYHDLDYRRLIVPEVVNETAPLKLLGTFRYSAS
jgi:hypothetical protein